MSTPFIMPQELATIPPLSSLAQVENAGAKLGAPTKRQQILVCPNELKFLDNNAEGRWNQLARTACQDFLAEFADDALISQLRCQAERERKNNLPYDDQARLKIWNIVGTKLGVKGQFTQPVSAPGQYHKLLPNDNESPDVVARVYKPKTWCEAIEIAMPFLGRSIRNYPLDGPPKTEAEHEAVAEYRSLLQKKESKLRAMVQAGRRPDRQSTGTREVDFIVLMSELSSAEAKMTPTELQASFQENVNTHGGCSVTRKPGRPKGAKDGRTVRRKNKKYENVTARVRAYRQRRADASKVTE